MRFRTAPLALFVGGIMCVGLFAAAVPAQAAGLTQAQVGAILGLLRSFDVDQPTITNVWGALVASAGKGSVSFLAINPAPGETVTVGSRPLPFVTFMMANNTGGPVTVNGITITRTGTGSDSYLSSVELQDSAGDTLGGEVALDTSHQATVGGTFTLAADEAKTLTVAGTIANKSKVRAGKTLSIEVDAINTTAALYGSLPINGVLYAIK